MTLQFHYSISSPAGWSHQAGETVDFADNEIAEKFVTAGIAVAIGELQTSATVSEAEPLTAEAPESSESSRPTPDMSRYPLNSARLEVGRGAWGWFVAKCSICGGRHFHGGGPLSGDARDLLGHRAAHCTGLDFSHPGYVITDEAPAHSAYLLSLGGKAQR
jgi:hypothetical protein